MNATVLRRPFKSALLAPVRVMDQPAALHRLAFVQRLLQRVEHEAGMRGPAHPPADDAAGIGVD
jgi:hypothetical protein